MVTPGALLSTDLANVTKSQDNQGNINLSWSNNNPGGAPIAIWWRGQPNWLSGANGNATSWQWGAAGVHAAGASITDDFGISRNPGTPQFEISASVPGPMPVTAPATSSPPAETSVAPALVPLLQAAVEAAQDSPNVSDILAQIPSSSPLLNTPIGATTIEPSDVGLGKGLFTAAQQVDAPTSVADILAGATTQTTTATPTINEILATPEIQPPQAPNTGLKQKSVAAAF